MKKLSTSFLLALILFSLTASSQKLKIEINKDLLAYTEDRIDEFENIQDERKAQLEDIGIFLMSSLDHHEKFSALFVCTHNSRRSHLADTWFKYGLVYYGIHSFSSYSGGTEATAFNENAISALRRAGFTIEYDESSENPIVSITPGNYPVWNMQSKKYTHKINPKTDFVAIMVCSDADRSCPIVEGAEGRFSLPYNDPRYYDNTPAMEFQYDKTVQEIATEMLYLADYLKKQQIKQIEVAKK